MSWQDVTQVNDGQDYDGDRHAEIRLAIEQLQAALGPDEVAGSSGWRYIDSGSFSGVGPLISVPAGFMALKLLMVGSLDGIDRIGLRVNSDSTAGLHYWGGEVRNSADPPNRTGFQGAATAWSLGEWATVAGNQAEVSLTNIGQRPTFKAEVTRNSNSAAGNKLSIFNGGLTDDRVVTSLRIVRATTDNSSAFNDTRWSLHGLLLP